MKSGVVDLNQILFEFDFSFEPWRASSRLSGLIAKINLGAFATRSWSWQYRYRNVWIHIQNIL